MCEERRDAQRMRERENRDRHKLRVTSIYSSSFFHAPWVGLNSTRFDQDITESQMGVGRPTYST